MKLIDILLEAKQIQYTKPNFENEWEEAIRYPEFEDMGKEKWLEIAKQGKPIAFSEIKDILGNVDLNFDKLEEPKKERFKQAFEKGVIEMSIVVKFGDKDYDLVAGNTRLSGLVKNGIDPQLWVVDISHKHNIQEGATCCGRCGRVHKLKKDGGEGCKKPYLSKNSPDHCMNK